MFNKCLFDASYVPEIVTGTGNMMVNLTDMDPVLMELYSLVGIQNLTNRLNKQNLTNIYLTIDYDKCNKNK